MGRKTRIGLIQLVQRSQDGYSERLNILESEARKCFEGGAELVFFPEAFQHVPDRDILSPDRRDELRCKSDAWKKRCSALAKEFGAYLVPWDYEAAENGSVYNSSYILNRRGEEIGRYRKVNLTIGEIQRGISHGNDYPVFDTELGKIGIMICFDNYFPESARILGNRGAELVLYPLYGDTLVPGWELKTRVRALDNNMYIASCQIDPRPAAFTGLFSPEGEVEARLEEFPSHRVVEAELGKTVITNMNAREGECQDCREYLKKCRYYPAYGGILEESPDIKSWDEIFLGTI